MSVQTIRLNMSTTAQAGAVSRIRLVSQSVTGPTGSPMSAAAILAALLTVDGAGSGLDADLLDGNSSTAFATSAQGATADTAVQPARSISTTAPLTGGGDLSADRTLAVSTASAIAAGVVELATDAEAITGTATDVVTTPANVAALWSARGVQGTRSTWWFSPSGTRTTGTLLTDRGYFVQLSIPRACTVDRIACEVTAGGGAGSVVRLGIYNAASDGLPGTLLLDAGTVSGTGIAIVDVTISQYLAVGVYYLCAAAQVGTTPTMRSLSAGVGATSAAPNLASNSAAAFASGGAPGLVTGGSWATGALPASSGTISNSSAVPVLSVRFV